MVKKGLCRGITFFYRENTTDENVLEGINRDDFFSEVPEYFPHRKDVIIDVGAHIGSFSLLAAQRVEDGKVFAIEASKETYDYLQMNIRANHFHNVFAFYLALTDYKGTTRLYHSPEGNWGHTIAEEVSGEYESVPTDTLANFIADNKIEKCDFMKMNCEGAEFAIILNSSNKTLQKFRIIFIKYHGDLALGLNELTLIQKLNQCGFSTTIRNKSPKRGWIIASNESLEMRKDELIQYSLWKACNARIGGRRVWKLLFNLASLTRRY